MPSHNDDGYILTGVELTDDPDIRNNGTIGKIGPEGDSIWFRSIFPATEDTISSSELYEVIATDDGYYMSTGRVRVSSPKDSVYLKVWMVKFDDDGHIVNVGDNSSVVGTELSSGVRIYPNPSSDYLYIENDNESGMTYRLYDHEGKLVLSRENTKASSIYIISVSDLIAGNYYLQIENLEGNRDVRKLVIQR